MAATLGSAGVVVIGRNEGERLKRCLKSLSNASVVYVDSGSSDGSVQWARQNGAEVIELDMSRPFTAARARNEGFRRLRQIASGFRFVQFVDGDCELVDGWQDIAIAFLEENPDIAAVCGIRRERYPERSIYNWLCDREWQRPPGETKSFGGDVMIRANALEAVGGYREDMIAGEEPELCVRLRTAGWRIWRVDSNMTIHDAAMTSFFQWWRRAMRGGYSYAHGAYLHGAGPQRHFAWEAKRMWIIGFWLPLGCLAAGLLFPPWGWAAWLIYPAQVLRQTLHNSGTWRERTALALFNTVARFAETFGHIRFMRDRLLARQARLIEYK